jgi:hypothetical protein
MLPRRKIGFGPWWSSVLSTLIGCCLIHEGSLSTLMISRPKGRSEALPLNGCLKQLTLVEEPLNLNADGFTRCPAPAIKSR